MAMGSANYRSVLRDIWGSKGLGGLYQVCDLTCMLSHMTL